jgi:hypothetical protein
MVVNIELAAAAQSRYNKTPKGKRRRRGCYLAQKAPVSKILKLSLNEIVENGVSVAQSELMILLQAEWDSRCGIPFHMDAPMCNYPLCNINRPAVLRISYGKDYHCREEGGLDFVTRSVYGIGSGSASVATDPRSSQTKPMSLAMYQLGERVRQHLRSKEKRFCKGMDLSDEFNSVTILLYIGSDVIKECTVSSLGYHCDIEYNTKGVFAKSNSQKENTPVVVLTLGDSRTVHMKKRKVGKDGKWTDNAMEKIHDYLLRSGSLFVLHPEDEKLKNRGPEHEGLSQFQHGGVKATKGLSMAIIFRTVTTTAKIHVLDSMKQLGEKDDEYLAEHYTDAYNAAVKKKKTMEKQLKEYVEKAKRDGTLFSGQAVQEE